MKGIRVIESFAGGLILLYQINMVKINGEKLDVAGMTVTQYLENANYDAKRIVVERNEDIVHKSEYDRTVLQDGDTVEVISFVGGG